MAASASPSDANIGPVAGLIGRRGFLAGAALALAGTGRQAAAQDQSFDVHLDTIDGANRNDGRSPATAVRSFDAAVSLMRPGRRLGIRRGSLIEGSLLLTDNGIWRDSTIGSYGSGPLPVFQNLLRRNEPSRHSGRVWKVPLAQMPPSSGYASQRITRATSLIVDGERWAYIQVGSSSECKTPAQFYHDYAGGWVYFYHEATPTLVEIPVATPIYVNQIERLTLQDLEVASSRDHGILSDSNEALAILRCRIRRCGLVGICIFTKDEAHQTGPRIEDCLVEDTHGNGIGFTASSGGSKPNQITSFAVRRNTVRRACMGTPWVASGVTSDDYYAGSIKLYSGIHDKRRWGWSGEIADNLIEHSGDLDRDMKGDHGQGIWIDTVMGSIQVVRNTVRDTRGAGIFVEFCPDQDVVVAFNRVIDTGQRHGGWTGGICLGRGTTHCLVHHNTVWNARQAALVIQGVPGDSTSPGAGTLPQWVADCTIRDNILIAAPRAAAVRESPVGGGNNRFMRNCVGAQPWFELSDGRPFNFAGRGGVPAWEVGRRSPSDSIVADPRLIEPPGNLGLRPDSPLIRAATDGSNIGAG